jgi:hypothetical protein
VSSLHAINRTRSVHSAVLRPSNSNILGTHSKSERTR